MNPQNPQNPTVRGEEKNLFLFIILSVITLPLVGLLIALPFKGTQYTMLCLANRNKPIESKIESYEAFSEKYPGYIPPKLKLLSFYRSKLKPEPEEKKNILRTLSLSEEILELDPKNEEALSTLIYVSALNKDIDKIKPLYIRLIEVSPENPNYRTKLAFIYISENDTDKALEQVNSAISSDPENLMAHFMAGDIFVRKEDIPSALSSYRKAATIAAGTRRSTEEANARFRLGRLLMQNKLYFDAAQELSRAARIAPSSAPIHFELAAVYFSLGLYDKVLEVLLSDPVSVNLWHLPQGADKSISDIYKVRAYDMLGKVYAFKKDYVQALDYFERANKIGIIYQESFLDAIREKASEQKDMQPKVKIEREDIEVEAYTPEVDLPSREEEKAKKIEAMEASLAEANKYLSEDLFDKAISTVASPPLNADMWGLSSYYKYQVPEKIRLKTYVILEKCYLGKEDFISALEYIKMAVSLGAEYESDFIAHLEVAATLQKQEEESTETEGESKEEQETKEE